MEGSITISKTAASFIIEENEDGTSNDTILLKGSVESNLIFELNEKIPKIKFADVYLQKRSNEEFSDNKNYFAYPPGLISVDNYYDSKRINGYFYTDERYFKQIYDLTILKNKVITLIAKYDYPVDYRVVLCADSPLDTYIKNFEMQSYLLCPEGLYFLEHSQKVTPSHLVPFKNSVITLQDLWEEFQKAHEAFDTPIKPNQKQYKLIADAVGHHITTRWIEGLKIQGRFGMSWDLKKVLPSTTNFTIILD
jgi:hypothetical protein